MGFFKKSEVKKNYELGKDLRSNPGRGPHPHPHPHPRPHPHTTPTPTTIGKDLGSGNFAVVKEATKTAANKQAESKK